MVGKQIGVGRGDAISKIPENVEVIGLHHLQQQHHTTRRLPVQGQHHEFGLILIQTRFTTFVLHFSAHLLAFGTICSCRHSAQDRHLGTVQSKIKPASSCLHKVPVEVPHHISRAWFTLVLGQILPAFAKGCDGHFHPAFRLRKFQFNARLYPFRAVLRFVNRANRPLAGEIQFNRLRNQGALSIQP